MTVKRNSNTIISDIITYFKRKLKENECLELNKKGLFYIGLWPHRERLNNYGSIFRYILPRFDIFIGSVYLFIVFPGGALSSWKKREVTETYECLFLTCVALCTTTKGYYVCFQPRRFQDLTRKMEAMCKRGDSGSKQEDEIRDKTQFITNITVVTVVLCSVLVVLYIVCVIPLSIMLHQLFFEGWYPYDVDVSPNFELTLLALAFVTSQMIVNLLVDAFFISLLIQTIGQFRLLRHRLKNIREKAVETINKRKKHKPESSKRVKRKVMLDDFCSERTGKLLLMSGMSGNQEVEEVKRITGGIQIEMERRIADCVKHHVQLLRFVGEIESAFFSILVAQIVANFFATILVVIWFNFAEGIDMKAVGFLVSILYGTYELFFFCWFANGITDQSSKVGQAVYESDWFDANRSFKRSMMIIISMCNQPIRIVVARRIRLSAETFSKVMNLAFSYFNALKKVL